MSGFPDMDTEDQNFQDSMPENHEDIELASIVPPYGPADAGSVVM